MVRRGLVWGGAILLIALLIGCLGVKEKTKESSNSGNKLEVIAEVRAEIIPKEGQETSYGIPLSLENTEKFIFYYNYLALTPKEEIIKNNALAPIPAPCCPDNPMSTCCCTCNLAKSVWGLSKYLIKEKGYNEEQVREAALEWLHFIRESYYIKEELKKRGIELRTVGLEEEKASCYNRKCGFPFKEGGCGGM